MASVGIRRRVSRRTGLVTYQVWWLLDDGSQGAETVASKDQARALAAQKRLQITRDTWQGRRRGQLPFSTWADQWWADWAADPHRSPHTLVMAESRLRNHLRPFFGRRPVEDISPKVVRQWQQQLGARTGYTTVMACRSLLYRVLQHAEDEGAILTNPLRKVPAPKRPVDPEAVLGTAKRRVPTPEEAGLLLAGFPAFWWDHVITLLGTGMRIGELAGLRRRRVHLAAGVVHVVSARYQAGSRYGSGFKGPKSAAGVRQIPLAAQVAAAIARRLPPGADPNDLVFTGPGGAGGVARTGRASRPSVGVGPRASSVASCALQSRPCTSRRRRSFSTFASTVAMKTRFVPIANYRIGSTACRTSSCSNGGVSTRRTSKARRFATGRHPTRNPSTRASRLDDLR